MFVFTPIVAALFIATAINTVVAYIGWQRKKTKGGMYFALGMMGMSLWTFAATLEYAAVPLSLKISFATVEAWGYLIGYPMLTLFAISFAGHDNWIEKKWVKALFLFVPISNILLVTTNGLHGWIWNGCTTSSDNAVIFEHGPAFLWLLVTSNLMTLTIIINLWQVSRRGAELSRRQGRLLLYAFLFPLGLDLAFLLVVGDIQKVDWTSITFSITGLLFLRALYDTRLLNITPIARDKVVDNMSDGMIVLDIQNQIMDINRAAVNMLGSQTTDLIGSDLADLTPLPRSFFDQSLEHEIKTELEVGSENKRYFDVLLSPLREGQKIIGRLIISRDITERKENELRLLQLTQAVEQSPTSVIITDPQGIIIYVNPKFTALTGYAQSEVLGKNPKILQSGQTSLETYKNLWQTILSKQTWRGEILNRKKNGELYWESEIIAPVVDHEGHLINFIATQENITDRKQVEDDLRSSEERFRQLVMSAPDAVFGVDNKGIIMFCNTAASQLMGYSADELIGSNVEILVPFSAQNKHVQQRAGYVANPHVRTKTGMELSARHKDGHEIPVEISLGYFRRDGGILVITYIHDITGRKEAEVKLRNANLQLEEQVKEIQELQNILREQAIRDPLTGLHNRHYLKEALEHELARAKRGRYPVCFVLMDIDHFKNINDGYGHAAGDVVLQHLASLLLAHTRTGDIVCRHGGEEFLVVLPNTTVETAAQIAERLRIAFQESSVLENGREITSTISLGISEFPDDGATEAEALKLADKALYAAKHNGRNQVALWSKIKNN